MSQTVFITPGTGTLALAGNYPSPREAAIHTLYLPGIALVPAELNYDQTVALVADQFEVAMNDSYAFLNRLGFATLSTGLLDPYLVPDYVNHITGGVVDEIELHILPQKLTSVLRGRDKAAYAADSTVYLTYSVDPAQPVVPQVPPAVPGFPTLPVIPGVTVPLVLHGFRTASAIAKDLAARVGLGLIWNTYDYILREDVTVSGPVLAAIQSLCEPFSHFERSKVDIWAEGGTLIIRNRNATGGGISMDAHDSRITDLVLKAKFTGYVRVLRILGSATGTHGPDFAVDPGFRVDETTEEMGSAGPSSFQSSASVTTYDTKIVTRSRIRILDNAQMDQTVSTFKDVIDAQGVLHRAALVSLKETISDWDDLALIFPNTIVNRPKENSRTITESGFDPQAPGALAPLNRTTITHNYSLDGYLTAQNTTKEVWDATPTPRGPQGWVLDSSETKQYQKNGAGQYQITTTQYGSDGTPGDVRRTMANGTPPGGPGRGLSGSAGGTNEQQITFATLISTQPGAKDITINNKSLLAQHMTIIAQQARAQSGSTEVEISFTAAGMPWLRRGQYITLTGLFAEDGTTPIVLPAALVTEARIEYRESSESPTYLTYCKAVFWES